MSQTAIGIMFTTIAILFAALSILVSSRASQYTILPVEFIFWTSTSIAISIVAIAFALFLRVRVEIKKQWLNTIVRIVYIGSAIGLVALLIPQIKRMIETFQPSQWLRFLESLFFVK